MKTLYYLVIGTLVCVAVAMGGQTALASVQFDMGANGAAGNHWTLGTGWGAGSDRLDVVFNVDANLPNEVFSLGIGQSHSFKFGTVQLCETKIDANETDNLGVMAYLSFDHPSVGQLSNPGTVVAFKGSASDWAADLKIDFDPIYVDFGNGGKFKVDLTDLCFDKRETICVDARVTLCSEPCPASSVPEPATLIVWSLFGATSWLGMRVWRRRGGSSSPRQPWAAENREHIRRIIVRGCKS